MKIVEVKENKKQYLDLLLLADEQEDMIDRYLDKGKMYVLDGNGVKCECVITDEGNNILEIKNIATVPEYQGKGYARAFNWARRKILCKRYSTKSRMALESRADSGLNPLFAESHGGQNGMRAGTA